MNFDKDPSAIRMLFLDIPSMGPIERKDIIQEVYDKIISIGSVEDLEEFHKYFDILMTPSMFNFCDAVVLGRSARYYFSLDHLKFVKRNMSNLFNDTIRINANVRDFEIVDFIMSEYSDDFNLSKILNYHTTTEIFVAAVKHNYHSFIKKAFKQAMWSIQYDVRTYHLLKKYNLLHSSCLEKMISEGFWCIGLDLGEYIPLLNSEMERVKKDPSLLKKVIYFESFGQRLFLENKYFDLSVHIFEY